MGSDLTLTLAFMTGLLGAGHCLGMCGGLAGGFAIHQHHWRRPLPLLAYHGSRIGVYVLLGALGAALGRTLVQNGALGKFQGQLLLLAGLIIILLGLSLLAQWPRPASRGCAATAAQRSQQKPASRWMSAGAAGAPALAGIVNGLVPCSLVFSVALRATATASPGQAALLMLAFGLGTMPMMGAVTALAGHLGLRVRGIGQRLAGLAVIGMGLWTVYEGWIFYQVMRGLAN